ncbi:MAG TPA: hypothetical protein VI776_05275 [Anaerolineales bacterium]|nr:hypothetical protein [Anaerolineales bacterium]
MKARLVPIYFPVGKDSGFDVQLDNLKRLLSEQVEFLEPTALGAALAEAEAAIFPQFLGEAYHNVADFKAIHLPILVITSEFGTVSMWDWEICRYLKNEGVETIAPYSLEQTRKACRALGVKRRLGRSKFLVFQDNPGEGMQAEIFKRFYWFEDECIQRMKDKFGVTIARESFRELGVEARAISDAQAETAWQSRQVKTEGLTPRNILSAIKIYLAVQSHLEADPDVEAVGINCLNESRFSDTVPCLAWNLLYEDRQMIWGCEADIVSMLTKYILNKSLGAPIMMTNLYPFLMGQAALKHERISHFPDVPDPDDHILAAHCGYLGVVPQSFSTEWKLVPKVLGIVDENAAVIDARMAEGPMTLAKLDPGFKRFTVAEGSLEGYVQYAGSDCRNGAVLRVADGKRLLESIASHHYLLMTGHQREDIELVGKAFDLQVEAV